VLALTGFGLGCLTCLFLVSWRSLRHVLAGKVFLLIIFTSAAYLIDPFIRSDWRWFTSDLQTALPGLFWLLCQLIFATRPQLKSVWGAMALYCFLVPALSRPFIEAGLWPEWAVFLGWELGQWFEYIVVMHGVMYVIRHWQNDLVEARRKARLALLLILGGAVGIATISMNFGLYQDTTRGIIVGIAALATVTCITSFREGLLDLVPQKLNALAALPGPVDIAYEPEPSRGTDDSDARQLNDLMANGFYKKEKLTLKQLATALTIPEYRVRRVINQTLGYRNFNDYINHLRINEASRRLIDAPNEPVLNISLDVGYRTLSSFNRAFRDIMDTTPTAYRQENKPENTVQTVKFNNLTSADDGLKSKS
jgi:AraC-like DNA-binding protein